MERSDEEWRDTDYAGYQVSNYGRMRSLRRDGTWKVLDLTVGTAGYRQVHVRHGIDLTLRVHRLVAKAFLPNPNGYSIINHKNEYYLDNRVCNLEWCNAAYNNGYGTTGQRTSDTQSEPIYAEIDGKKYWFKGLTQACKYLGVQQANAWKVLNGQRPHTCGYKFWKA